MEERMRKCKASCHSLPVEIEEDILSRLPVKSLCRFRCVSKSWRYLISDPKFVRLHRDRAFQSEHVFRQRQRVIYTDGHLTSLPLSEETRPLSLYSFDLNSNIETFDEYDFVPTKLNRIFSELKHFVISWVSHCNGLLVCKLHGQLLNKKSKELLYMLNPATRESKELPPLPNLQGKRCGHELYGFGFDYSIDDYKVVCGEMYRDNGDVVTVFSVYTLKTGYWRVIEKQFPYRYARCPLSYRGILVNGALHWLMHRPESRDRSLVIVSFVLAEEEVREIPFPVSRFTPFSNSMVLGAFREERLLITHNPPTLYNDIWIMMKYGNAESWTDMETLIPYSYLSRFCFWDQSWDLVVQEEKLSMYNFNENYFWNLSIRGIGKVGSVGIYLESLVSPNDGDVDPLLQEPTPRKPLHDPSQFRRVEFPSRTRTSFGWG
ncbi:hypothetical protein ABKV19_022541 [Rosa sericea]